jgi:hypothetical protein
MRGTFTPSLAYINLHSTESVNGEPLVRIDGNTEEAGVGVDKLIDVPHYRVPKNTSIPQIGKIGHIIRAVKLRWVDLADLLLLEDLHLTSNFDRNLVAILGFKQALQVSAISLKGICIYGTTFLFQLLKNLIHQIKILFC